MDTIAIAESGAVQVQARAIGRADFVSMQLLFNGKVIREIGRRSEGGHSVADLNESIEIGEPGWLALRIPTRQEYEIRSRSADVSTNILGKTLFAHTSPIYVTVDGKGVF